MKKRLLLIMVMALSVTTLICCNSNDDSPGADPIIGTWKLIEAYENGASISLTSCQLMENYIIGEEQFSHETFTAGAGKRPNNVTQDDDDEGGDDEGNDDEHEEDDDSGSDDEGGSSDDGSDDDGGSGVGGSGTCVSDQLEIGHWANGGNSLYNFTLNGGTINSVTLHFIENNTKFYYETTVTSGGTTIVKRFVFQRQ